LAVLPPTRSPSSPIFLVGEEGLYQYEEEQIMRKKSEIIKAVCITDVMTTGLRTLKRNRVLYERFKKSIKWKGVIFTLQQN